MSKRFEKLHTIHNTHTVDASNDLDIMQHIPADQLAILENTYKYMLQAIKEARAKKVKAERQSAEVARMGKAGNIRYQRQCLKIACMLRRGKNDQGDHAAIQEPVRICSHPCNGFAWFTTAQREDTDRKKNALSLIWSIQGTAYALPPDLFTPPWVNVHQRWYARS